MKTLKIKFYKAIYHFCIHVWYRLYMLRDFGFKWILKKIEIIIHVSYNRWLKLEHPYDYVRNQAL